MFNARSLGPLNASALQREYRKRNGLGWDSTERLAAAAGGAPCVQTVRNTLHCCVNSRADRAAPMMEEQLEQVIVEG
ncbi:unnamed protein product [Zymoseptoria tritici ST99CH_3D7]|uniref:Uncharacterized protein n=1 Tax=Zymoseptoria tritici (strain ST99CH_3D7) TaxID=1276538 RepID=A0A1X7RTN1_ZYMT9|nr:unnamed protein product [Zymoseptoria tritici ST99CH_3D7]